MSRTNLTIPAGLRGTEMLSKLQDLVEMLSTNASGAGDVAGDQSRVGLIYLDTTSAEIKQVATGGSRVLWPQDSVPDRYVPHIVNFAASPYTISDITLAPNILYADASGGAIVINLPANLNSPGKMIEVVKIDATVNQVSIADPSTDIEGYGTAAILLKKAGDRARVANVGASAQPTNTRWMLIYDNSHRQNTVAAAGSPYTVQPQDDLIVVNAFAGAVIINLPTVLSTWPAAPPGGRAQIRVKLINDNSGANAVTVVPQAGQTIDGASAGTALTMPAVSGAVHPVRVFERDNSGTSWSVVGGIG